MPRPEKVQAVADIKNRWENSEAVFITEYRGLTVGQMATLRRNLRKT
ncbi:MAG TPA: 50S ribosomal protein L10, partial [Acidimicrobiia bacterium]